MILGVYGGEVTYNEFIAVVVELTIDSVEFLLWTPVKVECASVRL